MEVTYHYFCLMLLTPQTNLSTAQVGTVQECDCQEAGLAGSHVSCCPPHRSYMNSVVLMQEETNRPVESTEVQKLTCLGVYGNLVYIVNLNQ